ncbi:MAG: glycosyltransferase family 4 protein [Chloroflexota bacterium]|nr:glycosyltransferase family 4 protein [Chloroflexota bacterium]
MAISAEYPPHPGGVGDYTRLLGRALIARGHRVMVLTGSGRTGVDQPAESASDPAVLPVVDNWSWRSLRPLLRTIDAGNPDIVHVQYQTGAYGMHPAINLLPALLRRRAPRPCIVVTAHDLRLPYLLPRAGLLRRWVTRRLFQDADAVIVTNAADQQALAGKGGYHPEQFLAPKPAPARVIPIGSNVVPQPPEQYSRAAWRQSVGVQAGDIVVAFFGLASPTKGLLELVEALAGLPEFVRLLVVGGEARRPFDRPYLTEVQDAVAGLGLAERVQFTGYCDEQSVSAHLLAADIGALPFRDGASYRRGSLLALLAHGLPLVTTYPETPLCPPLTDGEHVLLVPVDATAELSAALMRLVREPELRTRLGANGQALLDHFTWPAIAAAHEDVYNALLGRSTTNDYRRTMDHP